MIGIYSVCICTYVCPCTSIYIDIPGYQEWTLKHPKGVACVEQHNSCTGWCEQATVLSTNNNRTFQTIIQIRPNQGKLIITVFVRTLRLRLHGGVSSKKRYFSASFRSSVYTTTTKTWLETKSFLNDRQSGELRKRILDLRV